MPQERLPMRKIRDVLRLSANGLSKRKIAARLGLSATAAGDWPVKTFAYEAIGNLLSKSDVGTYTYHARGLGPSPCGD